jgi:hypothetical protein
MVSTKSRQQATERHACPNNDSPAVRCGIDTVRAHRASPRPAGGRLVVDSSRPRLHEQDVTRELLNAFGDRPPVHQRFQNEQIERALNDLMASSDFSGAWERPGWRG